MHVSFCVLRLVGRLVRDARRAIGQIIMRALGIVGVWSSLFVVGTIERLRPHRARSRSAVAHATLIQPD
ncbi:hypothetical protein BN2475_470039 [Paraburkholderia ribeironis]|uniref:Uncharacterized protein n=1 Tax=Paraburkholderia ribeironis TaxID=1247936 RepID=A0A1N7SA55_9BURK|nr:hypothetical protein BN2475_470039 [Paraburkholderia ribeironis]